MPSLPQKRILVVEDDAGVAKLLEVVLSEEGYSVDVALGGERAMELLGATPYDLVVLDLLMPKVSGWDILEALKEKTIAVKKAPRIIVLTAVSRSQTKEELKEQYRICDYLEKPFNIDLFLQSVRTVLSHNNGHTYPGK